MAAPVISNISRLSGKIGEAVRVAGQDLGTVNSVTFGGGVLARITSQGFDYLTFEVPIGAQSGVITITNPDGNVQTSAFTVNTLVPSSNTSKAALLLSGLAFAIALPLLIGKATDSSPDLSMYATTASVDEKVATKADKAEVDKLDEKLVTKADKTDVDKLEGKIPADEAIAKVVTDTMATQLNDYVKTNDVFAPDPNDPTKEVLAERLQKAVDERLKAACDEREKQKRDWWAKHGKTVIANRETTRLQDRETLKREILRELQTTNVTTKPTPAPVAIRSIELVPDEGGDD